MEKPEAAAAAEARLEGLIAENLTVGEGRISLDLQRDPGAWDSVIRTLGRKRAYRALAEGICARYAAERGEPFPFTEDCVAYELGYHINAYLRTQGFRGYPRHVTPLLFSRDALIRHCRTVEIDKADLNNLRQRLMFRYKKGLREKE